MSTEAAPDPKQVKEMISRLRLLGCGAVGSISGTHCPLVNEAADMLAQFARAGEGHLTEFGKTLDASFSSHAASLRNEAERDASERYYGDAVTKTTLANGLHLASNILCRELRAHKTATEPQHVDPR